MQAPRSRLTVDRLWYSIICVWAGIGLLNTSADHIKAAHHAFGWEAWWAVSDGLFGAVAMLVGIYHVCGVLRWATVRLYSNLAES